MATSTSNRTKMYLTTAGVLAFGVAAYGLGRVYPPLGPSAGTIAPAPTKKRTARVTTCRCGDQVAEQPEQ